MEWTITVTVRVERVQGKFASRDELEDAIVSAIEDADPGSLEGDAGGEYETVEWTVSVDR